MPADREELLGDVVEAGVGELLARVGAAFAAQRGWRNQLRAVAYELLAFLLEDRERARLMVIDAPGGDERVRAARDLGMQGLVELIDLGRTELDDPDSVGRGTAEGAATAIYARLHVMIDEGRFEEGAAVVPELMYIAVLPYLGPAAAEAELHIPPPPSPH